MTEYHHTQLRQLLYAGVTLPLKPGQATPDKFPLVDTFRVHLPPRQPAPVPISTVDRHLLSARALITSRTVGSHPLQKAPSATPFLFPSLVLPAAEHSGGCIKWIERKLHIV